jgi:uncharacterized membrane protein SpoIIM required for sporulation
MPTESSQRPLMRMVSRAERVTLTLWVILAVVAWNGIYDVLITRGVKEYLLRRAMHEAGRGPDVQLAVMMDLAVRDAFWIATLWASIVLLAGVWTIRMLGRERRV